MDGARGERGPLVRRRQRRLRRGLLLPWLLLPGLLLPHDVLLPVVLLPELLLGLLLPLVLVSDLLLPLLFMGSDGELRHRLHVGQRRPPPPPPLALRALPHGRPPLSGRDARERGHLRVD